VHNKNLKKVTGYINAWTSDIGATQKAVKKFVGDAHLTRKEWNHVKKTQEPYTYHTSKLHKKKLGENGKGIQKKKAAKRQKLRRRLQLIKKNRKTLESVNKEYRAQVGELEHNINHVIRQIVLVYKRADATDKKAKDLLNRENKTMIELKTFLRHILTYIKWTRRTMRNYARLFHTRPDNVFEKKAKKLVKKIKAVL